MDAYFDFVFYAINTTVDLIFAVVTRGLVLVILAVIATVATLIAISILLSCIPNSVFEILEKSDKFRKTGNLSSVKWINRCFYWIGQKLNSLLAKLIYINSKDESTGVLIVWCILLSPLLTITIDEMVDRYKEAGGKTLIHKGQTQFEVVQASIIPGRPSRIQIGLKPKNPEIDQVFYFTNSVRCQEFLTITSESMPYIVTAPSKIYKFENYNKYSVNLDLDNVCK